MRSDTIRLVILGAGGHAQVMADMLTQVYTAGAGYKPIGFLDDNPALIGRTILGLPVLGNISDLKELSHDAVIVAIGDNKMRAYIFESLKERGERFVNVIHPTAILANDIQMGEGVMVCAGAIVNTGTVIGDNVILNTGSTVDHHNYVASHSHIAPGVHLGGEVHIGRGVLVGIGANVIPGCSVGDWSVIGAGSVVTKNIPSYATAVGIPARMIKQR